MNRHEFEEKISIARGCMVMDTPYFASLAFGLGIRSSKGSAMPTIDGKTFSFPDEYIQDIPKDNLKGVLAAGSLACGLGHPFRMGSRNKGTWSRASCMVVASAIEDAGFSLPPDWPRDGRFSADTPVEDVYKILIEEEPPGDEGVVGECDGGGGEGGGGGGGVGLEPPKQNDNQDEQNDNQDEQDNKDDDGQDQDAGGGQGDDNNQCQMVMSPDQQQQMEQEWNIKMIQAAQSAQKSCGNIPGWLQGIIDDLTKPRVDWRAVLRQFLEETSKDDYSFIRRSRRFGADCGCTDEELSMPGLWSEDKPRLVVAMDYSGSVSKKERVQFLSELNSILEEFDIKITVVYFDSVIQSVKEYTKEDLPIQDDSGYGGTNFLPPFKWVKDNVEVPPTAMIVCSDMECGTFPEAPPFPVLWVSTQPIDQVKRYWPDGRVPFGEVLEVIVEHSY